MVVGIELVQSDPVDIFIPIIFNLWSFIVNL